MFFRKGPTHQGESAQDSSSHVGGKYLPGYQPQDSQIPVPHGLPPALPPPATPPSQIKPQSPALVLTGGTSGPGPTPDEGTLLGVVRWLCCLAQPAHPGPTPQPAPRRGGVTSSQRHRVLPSQSGSLEEEARQPRGQQGRAGRLAGYRRLSSVPEHPLRGLAGIPGGDSKGPAPQSGQPGAGLALGSLLQTAVLAPAALGEAGGEPRQGQACPERPRRCAPDRCLAPDFPAPCQSVSPEVGAGLG